MKVVTILFLSVISISFTSCQLLGNSIFLFSKEDNNVLSTQAEAVDLSLNDVPREFLISSLAKVI